MPNLGKTLEKETKKQLAKIQKERKKLKIINESPKLKDVIKNLDAYIKDTGYFLEKKDFVRAFEAVVYAWGMLDTLSRMHLIVKK